MSKWRGCRETKDKQKVMKYEQKMKMNNKKDGWVKSDIGKWKEMKGNKDDWKEIRRKLKGAKEMKRNEGNE